MIRILRTIQKRIDVSDSNCPHGLLLLNKPQGMTSNKALLITKKLFAVKKAGHTGSLYPLATGMLPICLGEATKVSQFLLDANKCYHAKAILGVKTDSADRLGKVTSYNKSFRIKESDFINILSLYRGSISQIPSMFSALKHKGLPLYKLARKGIEIERETRQVTIHQLLLHEFDGAQFSITVECSKGTYIRNLVEDIGASLGLGAHLTLLHRIYTAGLQDYPMYTLEELQKMTFQERLQCIIPMDKAIEHFPQMMLSSHETNAIRQGKSLLRENFLTDAENVRLYNEQQQFIGLGTFDVQGVLKAKRLLAYSN